MAFLLVRDLMPGAPLDGWQLSPLSEDLFLAEPEPMPPGTTSRFTNAFVGVGDLPCRKLFRRTMIGRPIAPPSRTDWPLWYLGADGPMLEFSSFWHRPTHAFRNARCFIETGRAMTGRVEVRTCGGICIHVNGRQAGRFEPFERNKPQTTSLDLQLDAGRNEILLHAEELCERDTTFIAGLRWLGGNGARLLVETPDAAALGELRGLAAGARLDREAYGDEPVMLRLPFPAGRAIDVTLKGPGATNAGNMPLALSGTLAPGARTAELRPASGPRPAGFYHPRLRLACNGIAIERNLVVAFTPPAAIDKPAGDEAGRRRQVLEHIARSGNMRIGRVLAIAGTGGDAAVAREILEQVVARIETREDCSDFAVPVLLLLLRDWSELLGKSLEDRARRAILGYRYWIDEPGNDVMWFWSENHMLCFHAGQYLAGAMWPEATFTCSLRSGREQARLGRERLERWFATIEADGFLEWHSPAYYPIDCIGLSVLHEIAPDESIRKAAGRALDRIVTLMALSTVDGIPASTQGRSYDRDLKFPALTETAAIAWMLWGKGALNPSSLALPLLARNSYAPPAAVAALARPADGTALEARYAQGENGAARLTTWKSRHTLLGTVANFHAGEPGYQAVVAQAGLAGHPDARIWINHPGQEDPFGTRRPSYWAGDGVMPASGQIENLAFLHYDLSDHDDALPFTHAFARKDAFDGYLLEDDWLFVQAGGGVAALMAANGLVAMKDHPCEGYELRSPGAANSWLLIVDELALWGTLARFAAAMRQGLEAVTPGHSIAFRHPRCGLVRHDRSGEFTADGRDVRHDVSAVEPVIRWLSL